LVYGEMILNGGPNPRLWKVGVVSAHKTKWGKEVGEPNPVGQVGGGGKCCQTG